MATVPTGTIVNFGGTVAPSGWVLCDGASYLKAGAMAGLFAVLGVGFGGDATHFAVPDYRGRSAVGSGQGVGLSNRTRGLTGGEESHLLLDGEMANHAHNNSEPLEWVDFSGPRASVAAGTDYGGVVTFDSVAPGATQQDGGNSDHNTMHPFLVTAFIIKT